MVCVNPRVYLCHWSDHCESRLSGNLPRGPGAYERAYKKAMERVFWPDNGFRDLAVNSLCWIACATKPLATNELQHALAVDIKSAEFDADNVVEIGLITSVCAGLVIVDERSNIIRLVLSTAQECFDQT